MGLYAIKNDIAAQMNGLQNILSMALKKLDEISALHPYLDKLEGVHRDQLHELQIICENMGMECVGDLKDKVDYFMRPRVEGKLIFNAKNGRFYLDVTGREFSSGYTIEIYSEEAEKWLFGRVEYSHETAIPDYTGYYFRGRGENIPLQEGMRAAYRKK